MGISQSGILPDTPNNIIITRSFVTSFLRMTTVILSEAKNLFHQFYFIEFRPLLAGEVNLAGSVHGYAV